MQPNKPQRGFSLFEMVVVVCAIVILYMVAAERMNDLPAAAERANYYAVLQQVKTGVNFEMVTALLAGKAEQARTLQGNNPMKLLIETPANYRGEVEYVTDEVPYRNSWYFEQITGELVYVVGGNSVRDVWVTLGGMQVNLGQIRLQLRNHYSDAENAASDWEGVSLVAVNPYRWERREEEIEKYLAN